MHTGVVATLLAKSEFDAFPLEEFGVFCLVEIVISDWVSEWQEASGLNHTTPAVKLPNKSSELIVCFGVGDTMNKDRSQGPFKHKDKQQVLFHQV